jgi:hypothetical protein
MRASVTSRMRLVQQGRMRPCTGSHMCDPAERRMRRSDHISF